MATKKELPGAGRIIMTKHMDGSEIAVEAVYVTGLMAVHKMPPETSKEREKDKGRAAHTVTHIPSGHHLATGIRKKTEAIAFVDAAVAKAAEMKVHLHLPLENLQRDPVFIEWAQWCDAQRKNLDLLKACEV